MVGTDIIIERFVGIFGYNPTLDRPNIRVQLGMMPATKLRLIQEISLQLDTPLKEIDADKCKHCLNLDEHQIPRSTKILVCTETIRDRQYETVTGDEFYEDCAYDTSSVHSVMWAYFTLKFINVTASRYSLGAPIIYDSIEIVSVDYSITETETNTSIDTDIDLYNEHFV
jgi:hypothetical protein